MNDHLKIVALGGGSGLATLLRGLKSYPVKLTAIVTMTDNGRSSGRLRRETGILPPGDVRNCLTALAKDEELATKLFAYRFKQGRGLSGHSLGNLLLLALADITGDFESAVEASSQFLAVKGKVIPSTFDNVNLTAELENGQTALGQVDVSVLGHRSPIKRVQLLPPDATANPAAVRALEEADLILVGPGSFYSSVVPNFLIKEIRDAFEKAKGSKLYVCNASTERGETENYRVEDHVRRLREYVNGTRFDGVIVNDTVVAQSNNEGKLGQVCNITTDKTEIEGMPVILADVIDEQRPLYHDAEKLADVVLRAAKSPLRAKLNVLTR
ncbi:MAG: YvcK family protein [Candidatus Berkelbacteria bacterium]|nr:MAG: YvcK family protein [Candidatus Berkelbacteria bacterium]QQG51898.1 MAG: YvcK family protein [Candidatus Berkelbacteria bacterium]